MKSQPHIEHEAALRRLTLSIITAVESKADVLQHKFVKVPDGNDGVFDPACLSKTPSQPHAYRYIKDIVSLSKGSSTSNLVEQFREVEALLIWGHAPGYSIDNVGQEFLDNYCHALLTGPDGPLKCASPLGAFVLFGPNTLYKDHSHTPNEVYLAITGGAEWRVDDQDWRLLETGETIFIPSEAIHAIRTNAEPVLTFSFWLEPGDMGAISI